MEIIVRVAVVLLAVLTIHFLNSRSFKAEQAHREEIKAQLTRIEDRQGTMMKALLSIQMFTLGKRLEEDDKTID